MKNKLLLFYLLLLSTTCFSQTRQDTLTLIDKAMSIYLSQNPGAQLSIKSNGEIIFSKAYGLADLEHNVPLTLTSKIEAGSVSKQFTAAAILLLEQQGKLSLNDDVRKYIPELPDYGIVIKLEQMMHHTSGLRDWGAVAVLTGWERTTKTYTNDDALEIMVAQKSLNNVPGAEFIYSNSNYNLLAILVQRVSGQSLAEFTKQHLFNPAGMMNTEWRDNHNRIVKDRAIAYRLTKEGYETLMPNEDVYGNGGLLTTTEDLIKWNDFYVSGKFGTPSLLSNQIKTERLTNGQMNDYGAGLFIQKFKGQKHIQHGGATAGYRAFLEIFPDINLSMAFLSNTSQFDTSKIRLENTIRDIFITENKPALNTTETNILVSKTLLNAYAGWYRNERDGYGTNIEVRNDSLFMDNRLLIPQSENKFKLTASPRLVEINDAKEMLYIIPDRDTIHYSKAETPIVANQYLEKYVGKFFSTETNSTITVYLKEGKLMINLKPNKEYELKPTYKDGFNITGLGGNLYFLKNGRNEIVIMKVSNSRARNIKFEKLK
jgi:CubicO group peptidase (beta-lactamase class C family)